MLIIYNISVWSTRSLYSYGKGNYYFQIIAKIFINASQNNWKIFKKKNWIIIKKKFTNWNQMFYDFLKSQVEYKCTTYFILGKIKKKIYCITLHFCVQIMVYSVPVLKSSTLKLLNNHRIAVMLYLKLVKKAIKCSINNFRNLSAVVMLTVINCFGT